MHHFRLRFLEDKKAADLAPDAVQYREYLGEYYHVLERPEDAKKVWRQIASGENRNRQNLVRLAEVFGGFGYEVMVPGGLALRLRQHGAAGTELTLHTLDYIEGGPGGGQMVPRLLGFTDPMDREFFRLLTSVKGFGPKKALRSLCHIGRQE